MLLLDLEELGEPDWRPRWFSLDRFNRFGFSERDHGNGSNVPLWAQVAVHPGLPVWPSR